MTIQQKPYKSISHNSFLAAILFIAFLSSSCSDESETILQETAFEPAWKEHEKFDYHLKIVLNSHVTEDEIFFYGPSHFTIMDTEGKATHYHNSVKSYPEFDKLPISDDYFINILQDNMLALVPVDQPLSTDARALVDMKELDSTFRDFMFGNGFRSKSAISISNEGHCLVPINTSAADRLVFYLFKAEKPDTGLERYARMVDTTKIVIPTPSGFWPSVFETKAFEGFFLTATESGCYKIRFDGSYKKVIDARVLDIYRQGNNLYANSFSNTYKSIDMGETWQVYEGVTNRLLVNIGYYNIQDSIIATLNSTLYAINFNDTGSKLDYNIRELENGNLKGNKIYSLVNFGDSVYASTVSGVFVRHVDEFFDDIKIADQ